MIILAILQNQWFKNPEGVARIYERHGDTPLKRSSLNARFLFMGSVTGRRLRKAFGEDLCNAILWEEASPIRTATASGNPGFRVEHIDQLFNDHQPEIVLTFGKVACAGVGEVMRRRGHAMFPKGVAQPMLLRAPHPAARHPDVPDQLSRCAAQLRRLMGDIPTTEPQRILV